MLEGGVSKHGQAVKRGGVAAFDTHAGVEVFPDDFFGDDASLSLVMVPGIDDAILYVVAEFTRNARGDFA
ncbi:hypothetical protein EO087_00010 [Dyella sp. M7H15-1]|nr:hypothetical protein EO087_00010 [Dyella sp. M7H15-1]